MEYLVKEFGMAALYAATGFAVIGLILSMYETGGQMHGIMQGFMNGLTG